MSGTKCQTTDQPSITEGRKLCKLHWGNITPRIKPHRPLHQSKSVFKNQFTSFTFGTEFQSQVLKNHQSFCTLICFQSLFQQLSEKYDLLCSKQMTLNKPSVKWERYTGLSSLLSYTPASPCCCDRQPANHQLASICPKYTVGQKKQAKISCMCHQAVSYQLTVIMAYHYMKKKSKKWHPTWPWFQIMWQNILQPASQANMKRRLLHTSSWLHPWIWPANFTVLPLQPKHLKQISKQNKGSAESKLLIKGQQWSKFHSTRMCTFFCVLQSVGRKAAS